MYVETAGPRLSRDDQRLPCVEKKRREKKRWYDEKKKKKYRSKEIPGASIPPDNTMAVSLPKGIM